MFDFNAIKAAVSAQNQNKESLKSLAAHLFNIDFERDTSVKIKEDNGKFYIIEFGTNYEELSEAKDFEGLIRVATTGMGGAALLDKKAELLRIATGEIIAQKATAAPRSSVAKIANKKESSKAVFVPTFADWGDSYGAATLQYFGDKIGQTDKVFLERYGVRPLRAYTTISEKGSFEFKELLGDKVAFSYTALDWQKKVQPRQPKDKKTLTNAGAQNYIFGLEQLPKTGDHLFIFEGESDVLLAAKHGFNAVCFGGVTKPIAPQIAKELKARFTNIIVFFDNEPAAQTIARELAQTHNFKALDAHFFFNYVGAPLGLDTAKISDICDLLAATRAKIGAQSANKFLRGVLGDAVAMFGEKKAIQGDKFSVSVGDVLKLNVNQYISENATGWTHPLAGVALAINKYKKVCLQAAAGAGKSVALAEIIPYLLDKDGAINRAICGDVKRVVIAVPVTPLAKQLQASLESSFIAAAAAYADNREPIKVLLVTGDASTDDKINAFISNIVVTTYDSVGRCEIRQDTLLVTDEAHQLVSDFSYRPKATRALLNAMQNTPYNLLLSATPNHLFNAHFGFKLVSINVKTTNKKSIDICYHSSKQKDLLAQIIDKAAAEKKAGKSGAIMIKLDNSITLRAAKNYAQSLGLTSEIFTSARREFKENSPNFQSLMQTGRLAQKTDVIFTTCLIEAGVSIKNKVRAMYILDTLNVARLIQQISRPRYDIGTGENDFIEVFIFVRTPEKEEQKQYSTAGAMLKKMIQAADDKAQMLNAAKDARRTVSRYAKGDPKDYILEDEKGFYSVDILQIFHAIEELSNTTNYDVLKARLLEDVTISSIAQTTGDAGENAAFDSELDAMLVYRDAIRAGVLALVIANKKEDAHKLLAYALTKERNVIERQITAKDLGIDLSETYIQDAKDFAASLPQKDKDLLDNEDGKIFDALQKVALLIRANAHNLNDALTIVKNGDKEAFKQAEINTQAAVLADRRRRAKTDKLTPKERNLADAANAVYKEFSNYIDMITREKRKPFLLSELVTIANKVLTAKVAHLGFKPKTASGKESVIKFLQGFYTVTPVLAKDKKAGDKTRYILERIKFAPVPEKESKTETPKLAARPKKKDAPKAEKDKLFSVAAKEKGDFWNL